MPPRISVIVPIYNAASTLRAAVQSILTQDIAGLEVLLVDDGSTDATPGLCHDLALRDDRIQVITQKNAGICAARNRGLEAAGGEFIAFCDDDDLFWQGHLNCFCRLQRIPTPTLCAAGMSFCASARTAPLPSRGIPPGSLAQ